MFPRSAFPAIALLLLSGCEFSSVPTGPTQHESKSVDLEKIEMARVDLRMGAGNLNIRGGSPKLAEADFTYNVPSWKPEFRYTNTGVRGELTIEQPSSGHVNGGSKEYTWDIRLNDQVPMDITAHFGAGESNMNLGSMTLRSVDIEMGVGELKLDLRGAPSRSYDVRIRGGVGEATVHLPKEVGIEADAKGGIGGVNVTGLHKENDRYVNDSAATAKTKIHLDIRGGVGNINLIAE
jgi:hypothetical protein